MAITTQDFTKGVDFTGINPATGGDHNNLVELAEPTSDDSTNGKGLILWTKDTALNTPQVPDPTLIGTGKWVRYLWLRIPFHTASSQIPTVYGWNTQGTFLLPFKYWQPIIVDSADLQAQIDAILVIANQALANANAAQTTANNASNVANAANLNATAANTNAANAIASAHAAQTAAENALSQIPTSSDFSIRTNIYQVQKANGVAPPGIPNDDNPFIFNLARGVENSFATLNTSTGLITINSPSAYHFRCRISAEATGGVDTHAKLQVKKSDGTLLIDGMTEFFGSVGISGTHHMEVSGICNLIATDVVKVVVRRDHNMAHAPAASFNEEIYAQLEIVKLQYT